MTHEELLNERTTLAEEILYIKTLGDIGQTTFYSCHKVSNAFTRDNWANDRGDELAYFYWSHCFDREVKASKILKFYASSKLISLRLAALDKLIGYITIGKVDHIIMGEL
tara:strand:- start:200 stop:529 length:330 start_codon:yes stop_codon:yes gene_type:complete